MTKDYARPLLALFALIIASIACTTNIEQTVVKGKVTCTADEMPEKALEYITMEYWCDCPDGMIKLYKRADLDKMSTEQLEAELCSSDFEIFSFVAEATATSTPAPTSTPTKRPTATPAPYLSGEVTACNLTDRYINFPIDPNAIDVNGLDFEVTIGGVPSTCTIPPSNTGILSCTFPQGQAFPARVVVNVDGSITNDFSFDGSGCESEPAPTPDDSGDQPAAPTEDPGGSG